MDRQGLAFGPQRLFPAQGLLGPPIEFGDQQHGPCREHIEHQDGQVARLRQPGAQQLRPDHEPDDQPAKREAGEPAQTTPH